MDKKNLTVLFIVSMLANYYLWSYVLVPIKRYETLVTLRQHLPPPAKVVAGGKKAAKAAKVVLKDNPKKRKPPLLAKFPWPTRVVIYGLTPGIFLYQLLRRGRYRSLLRGRAMVALTCLGLISDLANLWMLTPAFYFYAATFFLLTRAEPVAPKAPPQGPSRPRSRPAPSAGNA